ncbi:MAG: LapA family protein [Synergistaceae bacterium]|jgi:uncharacterized integral membrane protein|nr:LapA family protein [Synergistaceae bacterium]
MSHVIAVAFAILFAALYSYENAGDIFVKFLMFERQFPQGVWEAMLFSVGALIMWLFSLFSSLEIRSKYKSAVKERDKRIASLEDEKKSLIEALSHLSSASVTAVLPVPAAEISSEPGPPTEGDPATLEETALEKTETASV